MTIHKEGYKTLLFVFVVIAVLNIIVGWLSPNIYLSYSVLGVTIILFLIVLQFFRSPKRLGNDKKESTIICPADGKVVAIEEAFENEYFKETRKKISVFMSPFNVHVNRYPVSGKVLYYKYHKGKYLVAWHPKSSEKNERTTVVVEHNSGKSLLLRQIAGTVARRIICYAKENTPVEKGQEMGFIKFGSRVDIFLPLDSTVSVNINQKVKGGETILGSL